MSTDTVITPTGAPERGCSGAGFLASTGADFFSGCGSGVAAGEGLVSAGGAGCTAIVLAGDEAAAGDCCNGRGADTSMTGLDGLCGFIIFR